MDLTIATGTALTGVGLPHIPIIVQVPPSLRPTGTLLRQVNRCQVQRFVLFFADWTARVWKDCGIATEYRGTGMGLTENAAVVTDTLGTVV